MTALLFIALALILEPMMEKICQHLFLYQPMHFKLTAGKTCQAYSVKERITNFHNNRQTAFITVGVMFLIIFMGKQIFSIGNCFQIACFISAITFILIPLCEISYYRWSTGRYFKLGMTAKEMSDYHDFCKRYYRHSFSLNGEGRKRIRFVLLGFGICLLMTMALFTLIL